MEISRVGMGLVLTKATIGLVVLWRHYTRNWHLICLFSVLILVTWFKYGSTDYEAFKLFWKYWIIVSSVWNWLDHWPFARTINIRILEISNNIKKKKKKKKKKKINENVFLLFFNSIKLDLIHWNNWWVNIHYRQHFRMTRRSFFVGLL